MPAAPTGVRLLSALRRAGSSRVVAELPEALFIEEEELAAFRWLREYVRQHHAFPTPEVMRRHTKIQTQVTMEPLSYYIDVARQRALYQASLPMFNDLKDAYANKQVNKIIEAAKKITELERMYVPGRVARTFVEVLDDVIGDFTDARSHQLTRTLRGIHTGYLFMNQATGGGWQGTDNIALAGRIGDGKTYILLKHAISAWMAGHSVLFQSNEMGQLQLARRAVGLVSGLNTREIQRGRLGTWAERKMLQAIETMKNNVPFHCVAGNFTTSTPMLRALVEETQPDMIYCDASYLIKPEKRGASRRENLVDVADDLKKISIEFERPLMHSVQLNRTAVKPRRQRGREGDNGADSEQASETDNDPIAHLGLHMIAETDAVGANASLVVALARVPNHDNRRYYGILKGREGERGVWTINYDFDTMNFEVVTAAQIEAQRTAGFNYME